MSSTVALFSVGALAMVLARPAGRRAVRELLYPTAPVAPARAAGPLAPSRAVDTASPAAAPLPARWSARAPRDRQVFAIEDACPASIDSPCERRPIEPFYAALSQLERGGRRFVRVAHVGDSIVADDKITGRLRARLQAEFGDAGVGWLYAQRPTRWYHPRGVRYSGRGWSLASVVDNRVEPLAFGPGAAAFDAARAGATLTITTRAGGTAVIHGLAAAGSTGLSARVDDGRWTAVDGPEGTLALGLGAGAERERTLEVRAERAGARVFGVSIQRDARGVLVDNLGLVSSSARALGTQDAAQWERSLATLALDLVIVSLGTNDSSHGPIPLAHRRGLEDEHFALYALLRRAAGACLVLLPPDTAEERDGALATRAALPVIHAAQRRAAARAGCAVWDTFRWMGGRDSILRWHRWGLADSDHTHLSDAGGARIADAVADALLSGRDAFESRIGPRAPSGLSRDL